MKTSKALIMLFIFTFFLVGCSPYSNDIGPNIKGEVVQIEGDRFLVVDKARPEIRKVWFTTDEIYTVRVGLTVSVWASEITAVPNEKGFGEGIAEKIIIE